MKVLFVCVLLALCVYADVDFANKEYQSMSASSKFDAIWKKIKSDTKSGGFYPTAVLAGIFVESMDPTLDLRQDVLPWNRLKLIHTLGVVAPVTFSTTSAADKYTGMFAGTEYAFLRLSVAKAYDNSKKSAADALNNFTPGMSIKFLRDNVPSANYVSMFSVNGQASWDFFANNFTNHIPGATGTALTLLADKFSTGTPIIQDVGLSDMAKYDGKGNDVGDSINFPYHLIHVPSSEVSGKFSDDYTEEFTTQLMTIASGTPIYDIYAQETPTSDYEKIGTYTLQEQFTTSYWGDRDFFIQHINMEDDLKYHPEWSSAVPRWHSSLFCPFLQQQE